MTPAACGDNAPYPGNGPTLVWRVQRLEAAQSERESEHDQLVRLESELTYLRGQVGAVYRLLWGTLIVFLAASAGWVALILDRIGG